MLLECSHIGNHFWFVCTGKTSLLESNNIDNHFLFVCTVKTMLLECNNIDDHILFVCTGKTTLLESNNIGNHFLFVCTRPRCWMCLLARDCLRASINYCFLFMCPQAGPHNWMCLLARDCLRAVITYCFLLTIVFYLCAHRQDHAAGCACWPPIPWAPRLTGRPQRQHLW
jgi:hypothetical protein